MNSPAAGAVDQRAAVAPGMAAAPGDQLPLVITVHGTFASNPNAEGRQWWQRGPAFTTALAARLADKGVPRSPCSPFAGRASTPIGRVCARPRFWRARSLRPSVRHAGGRARPQSRRQCPHGGVGPASRPWLSTWRKPSAIGRRAKRQPPAICGRMWTSDSGPIGSSRAS